jgi:hypothetical protein
MPPEVDEEDEDEYTVMDIRWGQLTQGGPRVPVEVSETTNKAAFKHHCQFESQFFVQFRRN